MQYESRVNEFCSECLVYLISSLIISLHVFVNIMNIKETGCEEVNLTESSRQDSIAGFCDHDENHRSFSTTL